jgi:uncharacterized protein (TIGR02996 family)
MHTADEERFIRQIVETPDDAASRLVYADWLEDHGDPRADYLRVELAWGSNRDTCADDGPPPSAPGLDPVWVARLSRPPLGVCCDRVEFSNRGPELIASDLDAVEKRLGARLPADYRAFLLNYNGGQADPTRVLNPRPGAVYQRLLLGPFYKAMGGTGDYDIEDALDSMRAFWLNHHRPDNPFPITGLLPVAETAHHDYGNLMIGLRPDNCGRIIHLPGWDRNMDNPDAMTDLAPSFAHLLAMLED